MLEESDQKFKDAESKLKNIELTIEKKIVQLDLIEKMESLDVEGKSNWPQY